MSSYTNERGQIVYADNSEDVGIARPQGDIAASTASKTTSSTSSHEKGHGKMHSIKETVKETVKEGVQHVADGMGKLADNITNNPEHDHLSSKVEVTKE
uniref:Uncharacterized protein n=1 Tax=Panagrolaimus sp. ES5 TaxID=591445 RepID=A0AC34FWW5_9BILA